MSSLNPEDSENDSQTTIEQYQNTTAADTPTDTQEAADNSDATTDSNPKPKIPEVNSKNLLMNPDELPDHVDASLIYGRVSTNDQYENGKSLDRQVEKGREGIDGDEDAVLIHEPITDDGKTGTNFQRSGIKKVFDLASRGLVDRLYITKLNRIGRCAPETLYFVYKLQNDTDVTIVMEHDYIDISTSLNDLLMATMSILGGHFSVEQRVTSSIKSQISQFQNDKDWWVFHNQVPLGYEEAENDWIKVTEEEAQVVRELFEYFIDEESYTKTAEYISRKYGEDGYRMTRYRVKRILTRDVYIGSPSKTLDTDRVEDNEVAVDDPNLKIVDEEIFEAAQKIIQANKERYSSSEETHDPLDFVQIVGVDTMLTTFADLELHCPECGSAELQKYGSRETSGIAVHNYRCKDCGRQMKWPNQSQFERLRDKGFFK